MSQIWIGEEFLVSVLLSIKRLFSKQIDMDIIKPIFILSPPRSGSTFLFETMFSFKELHHFDHESDFIWWDHFPYDEMKNPSDFISADDATDEKINEITSHYYEAIIRKYHGADVCINSSSYPYRKHKIRLLDKTIANCFHIDFIVKAFPTAEFIFLVRDPRPTISSMIEGWPYIDLFGKAQLSLELRKQADANIKHWTYPAPPGWQKIVNKSLEEICAWSWEQHVMSMLSLKSKIDDSKYIEIKYEEMIQSSAGVFEEIASKFGLNMTPELKYALENPKLSTTTISMPKHDKWKDKNLDKILSILPYIKPIASEIGYSL